MTISRVARGIVPLAFLAPAAAQQSGPESEVRAAFSRAIDHIDALEKTLDNLARSEDPAAQAAIEKILQRLRDSVRATGNLEPADRALLAKVRAARLEQLSFTEDNGAYDQVVDVIERATGIPVRISDEAAAVIAEEDLVFVQQVPGAFSMAHLLDAIAARSPSLLWHVRGGVVWLTTPQAVDADDLADAELMRASTAADRAVLQKLEQTRMATKFANAELDDWSAFYAAVCGVPMDVEPLQSLDPSSTTLQNFALPVGSIADALTVIGKRFEMTWRVESGRVCWAPATPDESLEARIRYHQRELARLRKRLERAHK